MEELSSDQSVLPGRQRIHVKTFGCPHNQSDGEYLAGQLKDYGYTLVDSLEESDAIVINSCTVKHPSETRALNLVSNAQDLGKGVVLAGCVPSSNRQLADKLEGVSMLDVTQLDRIVEVVEETVKGNTVKLMEKRTDLPSLSLPKVRKHRLAEIITINAGCLGSCTYCKTKMSRGKVVSYPIDAIIQRALESAGEGVCQIELASEDMGAYGLDIGTNIAELLRRLSDTLMRTHPGVMIRTGMTNPPFIMQHVDDIIDVLNRPNVHAFMHIPVQSGSDQVLRAMRREYTVADFSYLADRLKAGVPELFLLTDIICGFPTESEEDWQETMALCKKYKFQGIHISQFYARPGTAAARLKPLKSHIGKDRYKQLADLVTSYDRNEHLLDREERVWFADTEQERSKGTNAQGQTVGRTKSFAKVLATRKEASDYSRMAEEAKVENQQLKAAIAMADCALLAQEPLAQCSPGRVKGEPDQGGKGGNLVNFTCVSCMDYLFPIFVGKLLEDAHAGKADIVRAALFIVLSILPWTQYFSCCPWEAALVPFRTTASKQKCVKGEMFTEPPDEKLSSEKSRESSAAKPGCEESKENGKLAEPPGSTALVQAEMSSDSLKVAQVAGLKIWEPKDTSRRWKRFVPKELEGNAEMPCLENVSEGSAEVAHQIVQAPSPALNRSGSFENRVRAEGTLALTSLTSKFKESVPCRCGVVRGKAQRSALKGFDCEQCQSFYAATKQPGPKPDDLKASRHRSDHAPTCTPPGDRATFLKLELLLVIVSNSNIRL
eukprot:Skav215846  [mRNA]  locus=scaffold1630:140135:143944:- [translate_table: standard]